LSLAREHDPLGNVIIRKIGDAGGPRSDWVADELDNLIAWARSSPRCIHRDTSTVNSAGAGPDVLHTFDLPANSLQTDGDYLTVWYAGAFAAVNRDKAVQAQFDGTSYENGGGLDIDGSTGWMLCSRIIRISATSVRTSHLLLDNVLYITAANVASSFNIGAQVITRNSTFAVANLNSNAITMRVRSVVSSGVPAAADVFQNLSIIELTQQ